MAKINGMNVDLYLVLRVYRQDDFSEVAQHKCLACCVTNIMDEFGDSGLLPNSTGYSRFKHRSQHRGALSSIGSMMPIQQSMHDYNMTLSPLGPTPSLSSSLIIFVFLPFSSLVWANFSQRRNSSLVLLFLVIHCAYFPVGTRSDRLEAHVKLREGFHGPPVA